MVSGISIVHRFGHDEPFYHGCLIEPPSLRVITINYFKHLSDDNGIPYQTLINLYLRDCAQQHKKLRMEWLLSK